MGLTIKELSRVTTGGGSIVTLELAFDDSYPTGGEDLPPAILGMAAVDHAIISPSSGYAFIYDYANSKVLAYWADYDAVADGALTQVDDTTDLSAVTGVRATFIGR